MDPNIGLLPPHLSPFPFQFLSFRSLRHHRLFFLGFGVVVPLNSHLDKQTLKYNLGLFDPDKPESPSYAGSFELIWVKETQVIPGLSGLSSQMQLQFLSMYSLAKIPGQLDLGSIWQAGRVLLLCHAKTNTYISQVN